MAGRKRKLNPTRNQTTEEQAELNGIKNKLKEFEKIQTTPPDN